MPFPAPVFVDSNILVYLTYPHLVWYGAARARWTELEDQRAIFWTSRQVIREFLAISTRPGAIVPPPPPPFLTAIVSGWEEQMTIVGDNRESTTILLALLKHPGAKGRQVHDANVVATMQAHGISYLLTHNVADFRRYEPGVTVLPLIVS